MIPITGPIHRPAAMIALESLMGLWFLRRSVSLVELFGILGVAFPLYVHHFWWHFKLGVKSGLCLHVVDPPYLRCLALSTPIPHCTLSVTGCF